MPANANCCHEGTGVFCPSGEFCVANGCCPDGQVCGTSGGGTETIDLTGTAVSPTKTPTASETPTATETPRSTQTPTATGIPKATGTSDAGLNSSRQFYTLALAAALVLLLGLL